MVLGFVSIVFLGFLFSYFRCKEVKAQNLISIDRAREMAIENRLLQQRLFSLRENGESTFLNFTNGLQLYALNTRPDAQQIEHEIGQPQFLLAFHGHFMPLALRSGQPVYFSDEKSNPSLNRVNGPPSPLVISPSPTNWKITPTALEDRVFIQIEDNKIKSELLLHKDASKRTSFHEKAFGSNWFRSLKSAKFWTADRLASEQERSKEDRLKLGFGAQNAENVVVCSVGDYLVFISGRWQAGQLAFAKGRPLAKLLAVSASGLTLTTWDETGFFSQMITIPIIDMAPYAFVRPESLFSSLKQRNNSEVSCIMGKRRVVLKAGTRWIKSQRGWHRLKSRPEIEDYGSYRILGELIIIDGLESFQGRTVIKGRLIDPLRLHIESFSLQVAESPGRTNKPHHPGPVEKPHNGKIALKPRTSVFDKRLLKAEKKLQYHE